ncbi:hypothetical protein EYV94_17725 [Puteibacter caeruleilacunae]|nr:hypothetical protein EYV94_17725 [Puteibacter caeruleilacunae]
MVKTLLQIRLKQLYRGATDIGIIRSLFLLCLAGFLGSALFMKSADQTFSPYIGLALLGVLIMIQISRRDKLFLKTHFSNYKFFLIAEYLIISAPVLFCMFYHFQLLSIAIILAGIPLLIHIDKSTKHKTARSFLHKWIPDDCIEWKAGVRSQYYLMAIVWIVGIVTSFYISSVPIAIFILGIVSLSFFDKNESYQILMSYERGPRKLLQLKIGRQIKLFSAIVIPMVLLFPFFHPEYWYIPVVEYLILLTLQIYVVLVKYAFYEPNIKSPAVSIFVSIGVMGGMIPILLPVVLLLILWFYFKSIDNLNFYLDDFNS